MSRQVILTGLRTNAEYHLGNYLGAILPMVKMARERSDEFQVNMFAPDLHSFTTPIDHGRLFRQTMDNLKLFIACGLPIEKDSVYIYRQSRIPAHAELTWILSCFTGFGEMSRMVEFKEKSERLKDDRVSVGLFTYPILMAADILLYGAEWVPVGEDQRQHLEFARDIATRFNNQFGDTFVVPRTITMQQQFVNRDASPRIRSLRDPSKKMSKSISDPAGTIMLGDDVEEVRRKIMAATTDSIGTIHYDWQNQPGVTNLLQIQALLSGSSQESVNEQWEGKERYGDLKQTVADVVCETLEVIQHNIAAVSNEALERKLKISEEAMRKLADETLNRAQRAVGLRA